MIEIVANTSSLGRALARTAEMNAHLVVWPGYLSDSDLAGLLTDGLRLLAEGRSSIYASSVEPLFEYREASGRPLVEYLSDVPERWAEHCAIDGYEVAIARLRADLGVALREPVQLLELAGHPCFFGQLRRFQAGMAVEPHMDQITSEFSSALFDAPARQLALNICLTAPERGGELELWDDVPSMDEYVPYGLARPAKEPAVIYKPSAGDLYLFESTRIHAVRPSTTDRSAISGFLAGPFADGSFRVWS